MRTQIIKRKTAETICAHSATLRLKQMNAARISDATASMISPM